MAPALSAVLGLPVLKKAAVLGGGALLDDRGVVGVSVIEVPVEGFVRRGELILSTAMGVGHDETLLSAFVGEVAASGAAALVLNLGPYLPGVPEGVVGLAERRGLPLLTLPWEVRFADVIAAVLRLVVEEQRSSKLREDLAWSLASGNFASEELAVAQGQRLGYDLLRGHVCAVGRLEPVDPEDPSRSTELSREVLDVALGTGWGELRAAFGAAAGESVLLFVGTREPVLLDPLLSQISERARTLGLPAISWGVGEGAGAVQSFQRSYSEAGAAVTIGRRIHGEGSITHIGRTGANRALMAVAHLPEGRDLQSRFLGPLLAHEERTGVPLLETAEALLESNWNLSEAARRLHLHRLSLKNRLKRMEELLEGTLSNPDTRFALETAVRLRRLGGSSAWTARPGPVLGSVSYGAN